MEAAVLERISVQQFLATLKGDEFACVVALYLDYTQADIAEVFGLSPATVSRRIHSIRNKYAAWNCG